MMAIEEGNGLLDDKSKNNVGIVDKCINSPKPGLPLFLAICLAMGNAADAVEIMCIGFIMTDLNNISSIDKELLSSAVFMGMLVGGILSGYLSDKIGRKPCLLYSLIINSLAGLVSAFSPGVSMLIVCRVIGGLGIGGSVPVVFSLGAEIFPSAIRGKYLSIIASFWMVGAIYTAFTAWIMLGADYSGNRILPQVTWRHFAGVSALPAITATLLTYYFVPESPRFLINKRQLAEAKEVLWYLSGVSVSVSDLDALSDSNHYSTATLHSTTTNALSPSTVFSSLGGEDDAERQRPVQIPSRIFLSLDVRQPPDQRPAEQSTLRLLFSDKLRKSTVVLMVIWFTLCFGSYGLSTWISTLFADVGLANPYAASFIFAVANLPGNLVSILFVETYGRRRLLSYGMCLAALSVVGFALDTKDAVVVVLCASLFNAFSVVGWNSLDCLSVECFPTNVRTSAMGVLAASGRLGAVAAQFVNGSLESNIPLLLFVTSACTVVGGLIAWLLPHDNTGTVLADSFSDEQSADSADESPGNFDVMRRSHSK